MPDDKTTPTDEELVRRTRAGDGDAARLLFSERVESLRAQVRRALPAILRRKVAESDVIQESFLVAFRRLAEFEDRGDGSFDAWLRKILDFKIREEARRYLRREKRAAGREVSRDQRKATGEFPGEHETPSIHAARREEHEAVLCAMKELRTDDREVLRLVHEEGLTVAEAAEHLGRSTEAARKLYSRAVGRLTKAVEERRRTP